MYDIYIYIPCIDICVCDLQVWHSNLQLPMLEERCVCQCLLRGQGQIWQLQPFRDQSQIEDSLVHFKKGMDNCTTIALHLHWEAAVEHSSAVEHSYTSDEPQVLQLQNTETMVRCIGTALGICWMVQLHGKCQSKSVGGRVYTFLYT